MPHMITGFRPGWKLSLFTLLMLPVLVSLGFWQLAREDEKLALQAVYDARREMPPVEVAALERGGDLQYMPVSLRGHFDNERAFLLDNRVYRGRAGYELIGPFVTAGGETVLLDRGWLPPGRDRGELPAIPPVEGDLALIGSVYVPAEQLMLGAEAPFSGWPRRLQALDTGRMYAELGLKTEDAFPYVIRLAEDQPGALVRDWTVVNITPERHRAYAVQWFAMAAVLLGLFIHTGYRSKPSGTEGVSE